MPLFHPTQAFCTDIIVLHAILNRNQFNLQKNLVEVLNSELVPLSWDANGKKST